MYSGLRSEKSEISHSLCPQEVYSVSTGHRCLKRVSKQQSIRTGFVGDLRKVC